MRLGLRFCIVCGSCLVFIGVARAQSVAAPTNVIVRAGDGQVVVSWDPEPAASKFYIYYSVGSNVAVATGTKVGPVTDNSRTISGLTNGQQYSWIVTAVDGSNAESQPSTPPQSATPAASQGGAAPGSPSSASPPTTNVGSTTGSNIQNPSVTLSKIPADQFPPTLSLASGSIAWLDSGTQNLINNSCAALPSKPVVTDDSTFTLINVLRLADPDSKGAQTVQSNNWYIYSEQKHWYRGWIKGWGIADFDGSARLYGAENVILVSILLNDQNSVNPTVTYKVTVTKAQASNISDVYALLSTVIPGSAPKAGATKPPTSHWWGCATVPIAYKTSSVKVETSLASGGATPFASSTTFTNESKAWWDVSFALPVTRVVLAGAARYLSGTSTSNMRLFSFHVAGNVILVGAFQPTWVRNDFALMLALFFPEWIDTA